MSTRNPEVPSALQRKSTDEFAAAPHSARARRTWFALIRRPDEAAHVLGKLLVAVGEDNVLWGSDSIGYGPIQPAIDAFRAFEIPAALCERYGYPVLTEQRKAKILGRNAARVYGIDLDVAAKRARRDSLGWVREALDAFDARGAPSR